jgi:glycosyltransferase involved in cell wall biosynthesis
LKVLHFFKTYFPETYGGIEQVIFQLIESGQKYGVDATVLTLSNLNDPDIVNVGGHQVFRIPRDFELASTGFSWRSILTFRKMAKEVDVIHLHFPWPFMDLVLLLSGTKKPVVVSYHSDIVRQKWLLLFYKPLMYLFLRRVDVLVVASPNYFKSSATLNLYREKVRVIPYGLDKASYPLGSSDNIDQWEKILPNKFFLFVGVLRYYKGLHILIDALAYRDLPVVVVGSGPVREELERKAKQLGLKNIIFIGFCSDEDKVSLLKLCYGFIFPSHLRSEAFGISLLEAAMFEKPMISCEIGSGTTYINIHNETGIVVPPSDPIALHHAMIELWEDSDKATRMGQAAGKRYEELFTVEKMSKAYSNIYLELTKNL